jgi:hypothetical protein
MDLSWEIIIIIIIVIVIISVVGIEAGRPWDRSLSAGRVKNFHFSISSTPSLGVHPASSPMDTGGSFPGT